MTLLTNRQRSAGGHLRSILNVAGSVVRGLPLFLSARPRTPLRVLCIMAFDTLHRLRHDQPLSRQRRTALAALLDLGAAANAAFDNKGCSRREFLQTRRLLTQARLNRSVVEYLRGLRDLERSRPSPGGDDWQCQEARLYREAVVRLSLAMVAVTAKIHTNLAEATEATYGDRHLNILFRIVMQCQIIDDVLDYRQDLSAGLPSLLTAGKSLSQALEQTRWAAQGYGNPRDLPRTGDIFPLRAALFLVSACARLILVLARGRCRVALRGVYLHRSACPRTGLRSYNQ